MKAWWWGSWLWRARWCVNGRRRSAIGTRVGGVAGVRDAAGRRWRRGRGHDSGCRAGRRRRPGGNRRGAGTVGSRRRPEQSDPKHRTTIVSSDASSAGQWQIACEIKSGSALVFDRASLREYGTVTLFRWSAPHTRVAGPGEQIFTAVVNCREKTIEAAWPGRSRATYAGTCGRGLVEAVCAAAEQAAASPKPRSGGQLGAGHAGTPRRRVAERRASPRTRPDGGQARMVGHPRVSSYARTNIPTPRTLARPRRATAPARTVRASD